MKKSLAKLLLACMICIIPLSSAGCSNTDAAQSGSDGILAQNSPAQQPGSSSQNTQNTPTEGVSGVVDIDLAAMSSTMVYAEVFNMMSNPVEYMGKTVRMCGPYSPQYYALTDAYYHYVVVEDATSCCEQGLEFIWRGDHTYPDDYPEEQTKIEVTGVFGSYDELDITYYYLAVDEIGIMG